MIKFIRLISGEELIANIKEDTQLTYKLTDVVQAVTSANNEKSVQVSFIPFCPIGKLENGININKNYVAFMIDPVESIEKSYKAIFNSSDSTQSNQIQSVQVEQPQVKPVPQFGKTEEITLRPTRAGKGERIRAEAVTNNVAVVKG